MTLPFSSRRRIGTCQRRACPTKWMCPLSSRRADRRRTRGSDPRRACAPPGNADSCCRDESDFHRSRRRGSMGSIAHSPGHCPETGEGQRHVDCGDGGCAGHSRCHAGSGLRRHGRLVRSAGTSRVIASARACGKPCPGCRGYRGLVASQCGRTPDWQLDSLDDLDAACRQLLADGPLTGERFDLWCKVIGAYLGEVVIGPAAASGSITTGPGRIRGEGQRRHRLFATTERVLEGEPFKSLSSFGRTFPDLRDRPDS